MSFISGIKGLSKRALIAVIGSGVLLGTTGLAVSQVAQAADDTNQSASGCSYGKGGPKADSLCWIDLSQFGSVTEAEEEAGPVSKALTIQVGNYTVTATATVSQGPDGANGLQASAFPTWGGSVLGANHANEDWYKGTTGKPALYQNSASPDVTKDFAQRDTVSLSNIVVKDKNGTALAGGYSLVMADAESTGPTHEGFTWTSDKHLTEYIRAVPSGWEAPCDEQLNGLGTNTVVCASAAKPNIAGEGIVMVSANAPTTVTSSFNNAADAGSRQGVAFALVFSTAVPGVDVTQAGKSNAGFTTTASVPGQTDMGSASSNGGPATANVPFLGKSDHTATTYTVSKSSGTTPIDAYTTTWSCKVDGVAVPDSAIFYNADKTSARVNTPANGSSSCTAKVVANPPTTGNDKKTINPNTTATLTPTATKAKGDITSAAFDNGQTSKTVPGEGTWSIEVENGQPVATFTPDKDYTGKVTSQNYTVTDSNGLVSNEGSLSVKINLPPTTDPVSVTVDQGATATLTPKTTRGTGDIVSAVFDNGQTSKTVPGEGTWTIKVENGQPVATFVPEAGFTGKVTRQSYTVTDSNKLSASSTLDVVIKPVTGPASVTVAQGEAATLSPKTTKGSGDITSAVFDNGETSKEVPGEGTWTIEVKDGQPVATFKPVDGFSGPVTEQSYTVTDANNLSASGKLDVVIKPVTGPASKTINPNETATLTPKSTKGSGDITSAVFDNGETSKTVPGEGTWTIKVKDGQPVATFTPVKDYHGSVTEQKYTVTDSNGLSAESSLSVKINVPPTTGDASKTIKPNETATLTPETIPGTGKIVNVTFDNGQTSKTVPGEGSWTIKLVDGQPVATFTPLNDYKGKVTSQTYTVTDENGLSANGVLSVNIVEQAVPTPSKPATPTPSTSASPASKTSNGASLPHTGAAVLSIVAAVVVFGGLGLAFISFRKRSRN